MSFKPNKQPNKVFTPRAAHVNEDMYVERKDIEKVLYRSLGGSKCLIIRGESGNGKTWLYKRVLGAYSIPYVIVNLLSSKSPNEAIKSKLGDLDVMIPHSVGSEVDSGVKPFNTGVSVKQVNVSLKYPSLPVLDLARSVRSVSGQSPAFIIFDNFEQILDKVEYVKEVSDIIMMADDESFSKYNVKVLIVGTPSDIRSLLSKTSQSQTISNRLTEVPEVSRMSMSEAIGLISKGLFEEIGLDISIDKSAFLEDVCWKTDRIAQHLHELCLHMAHVAIDNGGVISNEVVTEAVSLWSSDSLSADWSAIESLMNSKETKVGRKNQVLYCIGHCDDEDFSSSSIEQILKHEFLDDGDGTALNIAQILSEFSSKQSSIIRRVENRNAYRLVSPKHRMTIRAKLRKTEDGKKVEKVL